MPENLVPVYKLETQQDLEELAANGGWESAGQMCVDVGLDPAELLGTYQEGGDYEFEGEEKHIDGMCEMITWFGREHSVVRNTYPLYTDAKGNLFALMEEVV